MKKTILFLIFLGLLNSAYAFKMASIYTSESPVVNQDNTQRDLAVQKAFSETLVKVSGTPNVLTNPTVKAALSKAQSYVQEYSYLPSPKGTAPFLLKVEFDPNAIQELLSRSGMVVWSDERPLIVAWLLSNENEKHAPELIDNTSMNELAKLLDARAKSRGLPLLLPIMDATDLSQTSIADVQSMSISPLQKASVRYQAEGILVGNIQLINKKLQSRWKLAIGTKTWEWDINGDSASSIIESLIDKIIDVINNHEEKIAATNESYLIGVTVKGIAGQDDLNSLLSYVKHLPMIKKLTIENVSNDEVLLNLVVEGAKQTFMQKIASNQHLKLQLEEENNLTYLWIK
ncbi:MAG TPA: DUF2066 domain-containing protein [Gammaproteobacteria bacterium]|nr:DUF2066 domain-containing protein [Gammaproteobacteria bacterium]